MARKRARFSVAGPLPLVSDRHNRQRHIRWVLMVMQNPLTCHRQLSINTKIMARIRVAIPAGKIAARHVQADAVPSLEDVAGGPQVDVVLVGASRLDQRWSFTARGIAIAGADNTVGQVLRVTF